LRFCIPLTPEAAHYFAPLMIGLSIASILYGGAIALAQTDIKKLVAYSSVAHMGFVTLGIFLFEQAGVQGAILQMLNHGIITGALFMLIGAVYERSHSRDIGKNRGLARSMPAFIGFWGLFALASLGFPGTNGFVGEILVFISAFRTNTALGLLAVPGALLGAAYMFRVSLKMIWDEPAAAGSGSDHASGHGDGHAGADSRFKDLNRREWTFLVLPAALVIFIGLVPGPFLKLIDPSINKLLTDYHTRAVAAPVPAGQPASAAHDGLLKTHMGQAVEILELADGQRLITARTVENTLSSPQGGQQ
jgi:NADH-quinone oxidoreductase subunit M